MNILLITMLPFFLLSLLSTVYRHMRYSPQRIGKQGEKEIKKILGNMPEKGVVLSNLYFFNSNYSTEVDMVYIDKSGIYVVESKNYQGAVYGSWADDYWTQVVRGKKYSFYSPIKQNRTHLRAVETVVREGIDKSIPIYSLIAFSDKTNLNVTPRKQSATIVCKYEDIRHALQLNNKEMLTAVSDEDIDAICAMLKPYTRASFFQKRKHKRYVVARAKASSSSL